MYRKYEEADDHSWSFAAGLFVGALVGAALAGLYTPRSGPQNRELVREKSLVLKERAGDVATTATTRVSDVATTVSDKASTVATTVADKASDAVTTVQEAASTAATKVGEVASTATEKASTAASTAATRVSDVASTATEKARNLTGRGGDATDETSLSAQTSATRIADTSMAAGAELERRATAVGNEAVGAVEQAGSGLKDRIAAAGDEAISGAETTDTTRTMAVDAETTRYDTATDMVITDTSVGEMNDAARALESDVQFEADTSPQSGARTYTSTDESGGGEVRGTSEDQGA